MPALSSYVRIRCISYWMQNICLLLSDIFHVLPAYIQAWKGTDRIRYPVSLFFIWIDSYFYCPVYLSHPDSLYTDGLFQQVLYFKDFFCSLLHLIVQHLSAIFHNQNQTKTLNELLSKLIMYTHLLLISTVQIPRAYCSFFYYNIFIVSEQVFLRFFMNLSRHARMCNSSHHL